MRIEFDHIGILLSNLVHGLASLQHFDWPIGKIQEFPTEGTKEVYIGPPSSSGRLLFLEPIGDGPYQEALKKRGPGIHHIGINVDDLLPFLNRISGSGWYLHPKSLITFKNYKTVWLARPGVPLLVEVVQKKSSSESKRVEFVTQIEIPLPENKPLLATAIGIDQLRPASDGKVFITIGSDRLGLSDLLSASSH